MLFYESLNNKGGNFISIEENPIYCPECHHPFAPSQIERLKEGYAVICEVCGYEYHPNDSILRDIQPQTGFEPPNLYGPADIVNPIGKGRRPFEPLKFRHPNGFMKKGPRPLPHHGKNRHPFQFNQPGDFARAVSRITSSKILSALKFNWISLNELANRLGVFDERGKYALRMRVNELAEQGLIEINYKVNKILLRRKRQ